MANETILVIEDDRAILKMLRSHLEAAGYKYFAANTASDGLLAIEENCPDLVILDLILSKEPVFTGISDGYGLLRWLRSYGPGQELPVIIHTSDNTTNVDTQVRDCNVSAVIRKDEPPAHLLDIIRQVLDARPAPPAEAASEPSAEALDDASSEPPFPPESGPSA